MTNSIYWLLILAVLVFIEIITLGLSAIWFAVGALIAFIISLIYDDFLLEIVMFIITALALLYFIRPVVLNCFHSKNVSMKYPGIGRNAVVLDTIDNRKETGSVRIDGQEWSACSFEGTVIEKGAMVKISGISGKRLVVSRYLKLKKIKKKLRIYVLESMLSLI